MADNHSPVKTLLTTGFGTGFSPIAPGTAGSLATCILFIILLAIPTINHTLLRIIIGTVAIASIAGCIGLGSYMELRFGKKDPGQCTLDEWAGQAITLCAIPLGDNWQQHIIAISAAFAAFRFFDVLKPPPVRNAENLPRGTGVAADDVIAGLFAAALCQILRVWI